MKKALALTSFVLLVSLFTASLSYAAGHYALAYWRELGSYENSLNHSMYVHVFDENGNPKSGVNLYTTWDVLLGTTNAYGYCEVTMAVENSYDMKCVDGSGSTSDVAYIMTTRRWPDWGHYSYDLGFMYKTSPTNPTQFDTTLLGTLNTAQNYDNDIPCTRSLAYYSSNYADRYTDQYSLGNWSDYFGQTFVANGNRVIAARVQATLGGGNHMWWSAQILQGGPGGAPIGPVKTTREMVSDEFFPILITWGVNEVPVTVGNTYFLKVWNYNGGGMNVYRCNNNYANGVYYETTTPYSAQDIKGMVVCGNSGPPPSELTNPNFENGFQPSGVATGWNSFVVSGSPAFLDETTWVHGGSHAQRWWTAYSTHDGGLYQQVSATQGTTYTFSAWTIRFDAWNNGSDNEDTWVGIDPTGGADATSPNVVWSPVQYSYGAWTNQSVSATAQGNVITCFIRGRANYAGSSMIAIADDASLTSGGGCTAPSITTQPTSQTKCVGESASFSVTASGTTPLSYQWRKGGSNISGATLSSYTIGSVAAGDAGSYDCVVSNSCGTVTSSAAVLTVTTAPSITTQPQSQTKCVGASVTFSVTASGSSLTYQWRKGGSNISGATLSSYTIASVAAGDAGSYDCVVGSSCGSVASNAATLTVNTAPSITTHPQSQTKNVGESVTFTVAASGTTPLSYQWRKNGSNITGATLSSYTIASVQTSDAGSYDCVVSNLCGAAASNAAVLTVNAPGVIVTENFETMPSWSSTFDAAWGSAATWSIVSGGQLGNFLQAARSSQGSSVKAIVYTVPANTAITVSAYMKCPYFGSSYWMEFACRLGSYTAQDFDANPNSWTMIQKFAYDGVNGNGNTWTQYSVPVNTGANTQITIGYKLGSSGGAGPTVGWDTFTIAQGCTPPSITTQPVSQTKCAGQSATFSVVASGTTPAYQWRKGGSNISGATLSSYTIASVQTSDAGSYDCVVSNSCGTVTSNAATLTVNTAPSITTQPQSQTKCAGQSVTFSVVASGTTPAYQWRKGGSNISGATLSSYTIGSVASGDAGNYDCVVSNSCGTVTSNAATLTVNTAPSITTQPQSQTKCAGQSVTFSVTASGTAPLSYQWQKNASNISGATASSYTIASVQSGDAGSYRCIVSNSCGTVTSNAATLTVNTAPAITTQPQSQTKDVGASCTFSVAASGGTLSYQWKKDGSNISGATASSYVISSVSSSDAGSYTCVVSNSCGTVTSSAAVLTVNPVATEYFETMPSWSSTFDAAWGSAATWSIVSGGQSGNFLQAARSSQGSSVKAKVYTVPAGKSLTVSCYMKCPYFGSSYWMEFACKLGSNTAQNFDADPNSWTMIKKFAYDGTNGNGNVWTKYSATVSTGANTQITIGYKLGSSGGAGPTVGWDTFEIR